jgi:hypothetical protein
MAVRVRVVETSRERGHCQRTLDGTMTRGGGLTNWTAPISWALSLIRSPRWFVQGAAGVTWQ